MKVLPYLLPLSLLALWLGLSEFANLNSKILVSPFKVLHYTAEQIGSKELYFDILASLGRYLVGLTIGSILGLLAGVALGASSVADKLFGPSFHGLKQIATFAWIPLLTLWFGLDEPAKIAFIALASFYPMAINSYEGVRAVPAPWIELAKTLRFSRIQTLFRVILPASAPALSTGLNLAMIYAWLGTLGAEYFLASGWGLGHSIIEGREHFRMEQVLFGIVIVAILGLVQTQLHRRWERSVLHWNRTSR